MFPSPTQFVQHTAGRNYFRMTLAYDGTDFHGWQVQPGRPTVQGELAKAIRMVTGEEVLPQGCSRTDTGVHAEAQTVSFSLRANIPADRLQRALNRRLPPGIRVMSAASAPANFHARAEVLHKTYEYRIFERCPGHGVPERVCPPMLARYVWDCRRQMRLEAMQQTAAEVVGTHDFTSFAATDPDRAHRLAAAGLPVSNIRTVHQSAWHRGGDLFIYRITGTGFLHHMVRNIVGTCVEAGSSRAQIDTVSGILHARDRRLAGPTAPPQGLHLVEVVYADDLSSGPIPATATRT